MVQVYNACISGGMTEAFYGVPDPLQDVFSDRMNNTETWKTQGIIMLILYPDEGILFSTGYVIMP